MMIKLLLQKKMVKLAKQPVEKMMAMAKDFQGRHKLLPLHHHQDRSHPCHLWEVWVVPKVHGRCVWHLGRLRRVATATRRTKLVLG